MHLLKDDSAAVGVSSPALVGRSGSQEFSADVAPSMDHLDQLEAQSIYIFREAFARLKKIALLWSLGKDSNVMIWLARKSSPAPTRTTGPVLRSRNTGKNRMRYSLPPHTGLTGIIFYICLISSAQRENFLFSSAVQL